MLEAWRERQEDKNRKVAPIGNVVTSLQATIHSFYLSIAFLLSWISITFPPFLLASRLCFPRRDRNCESSSTRALRVWYACCSNCLSTAGLTYSSTSFIAAIFVIVSLSWVSPPLEHGRPCFSISSSAACTAFRLSAVDDEGMNEICRSSGRRMPRASTSVSLSRRAWAAASSLASARSSCSFNSRPRSWTFNGGGG